MQSRTLERQLPDVARRVRSTTTRTARRLSGSAHWLLRTALFSVFAYHGFQKFPNADALARDMGIGTKAVVALGVAEVLGAVLMMVGGSGSVWLTRIGAGLISGVMVGAIAIVHWGQWSFVPSASHPMGGMEFQVTLIGVAVYLATQGRRRSASPSS